MKRDYNYSEQYSGYAKEWVKERGVLIPLKYTMDAVTQMWKT